MGGWPGDRPVYNCVDKTRKCSRWAVYGWCGKNSQFMLNNCKKSCNLCQGRAYGIAAAKTDSCPEELFVILSGHVYDEQDSYVGKYKKAGTVHGYTYWKNEDINFGIWVDGPNIGADWMVGHMSKLGTNWGSLHSHGESNCPTGLSWKYVDPVRGDHWHDAGKDAQVVDGADIIETEIGSEFNNWGSWGAWSLCPIKAHGYGTVPAVGFAVRHNVEFNSGGQWNYHSDDGQGFDNSGLNSICLVCKETCKGCPNEIACSYEGPWGKWSSPFNTPSIQALGGNKGITMGNEPLCYKGLQKISVENQKYQQGNDDVALYYIGMYCGLDSNVMLRPPGITPGAGDSNGFYKVPGIETFDWECQFGTVICGIKTATWNYARRVRRDVSGGLNATGSRSLRSLADDVSLTGVKFKCCKL